MSGGWGGGPVSGAATWRDYAGACLFGSPFFIMLAFAYFWRT